MPRLGLHLVELSAPGAPPLQRRCATVVATRLALVVQPTDLPDDDVGELLPIQRLRQRRLNRLPDPRPEGTAA